MLLGCACIFQLARLTFGRMGGSGGNNGIWGSPRGGGSQRATSIFMKFDQQSKKLQ